MPQGVIVAHIFISYATADRPVAEEIAEWLRAAGHEPFLDHDLHDGIGVGEDWRQRLYRELRQVDAVLGVVTSSFVASNWCSAEVGIADALGCRLMPVRAEAGVVHPLMWDLQYADYQADPDQARERVLQAIWLLEDGAGTWREGENPFPGLEAFTAAFSRVFFGRATEAREVGNRLRARGGSGGLLALVGPSGCGKSSLLNAAVVPLLGRDPLPELARVLAVTATRVGLGWSASEVRGVLEGGADGLRRVADDLLAAGPATHQGLVVLIDQAEELFTRTPPQARQRFAHLLGEALAGPVQMVAAMRSEFLPLIGHTDAVLGVAFSPDGHTLATTSNDQTVRLWDLSDRNQPHPLGAPLIGHTDAVYGVAFSPDGHNTLATTSFDRTVRLWDLPRLEAFHGDEVHEACLRAGGPLDKPTWDQYAPGLSYQDTCANR